jgi:hypothetical protein
MVAPVLIRLPDVSALDGYTQFGMASKTMTRYVDLDNGKLSYEAELDD